MKILCAAVLLAAGSLLTAGCQDTSSGAAASGQPRSNQPVGLPAGPGINGSPGSGGSVNAPNSSAAAAAGGAPGAGGIGGRGR